MKRSRYSRLNPAMQFGQLVERGNSSFIREDEGHGTTLARIGGLALCAGLGFGHGSELRVVGVVAKRSGLVGTDCHGIERPVAGFLEVSAARVNASQAVDLREGFAASRKHGAEHVTARANGRLDALRLGGLGFGGRAAVQDLLRSVTVGGSSHVTSDTSTTVRRRIA